MAWLGRKTTTSTPEAIRPVRSAGPAETDSTRARRLVGQVVSGSLPFKNIDEVSSFGDKLLPDQREDTIETAQAAIKALQIFVAGLRQSDHNQTDD